MTTETKPIDARPSAVTVMNNAVTIPAPSGTHTSIEIWESVTTPGAVWLRAWAPGTGFCFDANISPDEADALAEALHDAANEARQGSSKTNADAVINAARMVA